MFEVFYQSGMHRNIFVTSISQRICHG